MYLFSGVMMIPLSLFFRQSFTKYSVILLVWSTGSSKEQYVKQERRH